ncbi:MAG: tetratricopeptide repeat protein [Nitrospirota bacterium]
MALINNKTRTGRIFDMLLLSGLSGLVFVLSLRRLADYDLWGHMKAGEYFFRTGSILKTHYFNCSWPEFPYLNHEWLFQAITYGLFNAGGEAILVSLQIFLLSAAFVILYRTVRLYSDNIPLVVFVLAIGTLASSHRFVLRPQHFSYLFLLINLFCLHQYSKGRTGYLYILPVVMLLWVNIHAESLWGIAVPGIFVVIDAVKIFYWKKAINNTSFPLVGNPSSERLPEYNGAGRTSRGDKTGNHNYELLSNFKKLISVYVLVIATSLINPFTYKTVIWPLLVMSEQFAGVEELLPSTAIRYLPFWIYFGVFMISVPFSLSRIKVHFIIISLFFAVAAWTANRGIPHFVFASAPVVAAGLSHIMQAFKNVIAKGGLSDKSHTFQIFIKSIIFVSLLFSIASIMTNPRYLRKYDSVPYPEGAVGFIKKNNITGNMFNLHGWGGYLVWELYPDVRTYIDNRFFHRRFFEEYENILSGGMQWHDLLDRYNINIILLDYSPSGDLNLRDRLFRSAEWELVYWDDFSLLYLKNKPEFAEIHRKYSMHIINPDTGRFDLQGLDKEILLSASEEVRKNIENAGDSWKARFLIGNIEYYLGEADESVKNLEDAVKLSIEPVPAIYFNLGQAYMASGRLSDAEKSFRKVVEIAPDMQSYKALWRIYILQGKKEEAARIFKKRLSTE